MKYRILPTLNNRFVLLRLRAARRVYRLLSAIPTRRPVARFD
jgi:hypothetical protein